MTHVEEEAEEEGKKRLDQQQAVVFKNVFS